MGISSPKIAVTQVTVTAKNELPIAKLTVLGSIDKPKNSPELKNVYQYLQFSPANFKNEDMTKAVILFKVPQSWLKTMNVKSEDVVLLHLVNTAWEMIAPKIQKTDSENVFYSAETTGFSYFAISAKQTVLPLVPDEQTVSDKKVSTQEVVSSEPAVVKPATLETQPVSESSKNNGTLPWVIAVILIILVIGAYLFFERKKR